MACAAHGETAALEPSPGRRAWQLWAKERRVADCARCVLRNARTLKNATRPGRSRAEACARPKASAGASWRGPRRRCRRHLLCLGLHLARRTMARALVDLTEESDDEVVEIAAPPAMAHARRNAPRRACTRCKHAAPNPGYDWCAACYSDHCRQRDALRCINCHTTRPNPGYECQLYRALSKAISGYVGQFRGLYEAM